MCNIPNYGTEEVADAALCHILNLYRRVASLSADVEKGAVIQGPDAIAAWAGPSRRVRGQVLGLVGFGRIGQATAARAKAFGFDVRVYDPFQRDGVDKVRPRVQNQAVSTPQKTRFSHMVLHLVGHGL